jgi:aromatic ring-cleaving dioxygenase
VGWCDWLGRQDSNLRMPVPKTGALPLGDAPAGASACAEERRYTGDARGWKAYSSLMTEAAIRDFHAHIYYDPEEVEDARRLAAAVQQRFPVAVGHFHLRPVGPHPRGSVQLTVPRDRFGDVAQFLALNRGALTVFAHAETGEDLADHTRHVIWFGPSEPLDLSIFG